ncbi:hypothetical protein SAMN05444972_10789 [Marininema halotolerans]|uniref:Uncharacterized protein n=1 Tax=Marininema halotolerans TaxID=1155944 RepID=A0A1I6SH73_9BACL|nr:hypothetical protein SAMN05444972_10789 [Marininema halotolerans]
MGSPWWIILISATLILSFFYILINFVDKKSKQKSDLCIDVIVAFLCSASVIVVLAIVPTYLTAVLIGLHYIAPDAVIISSCSQVILLSIVVSLATDLLYDSAKKLILYFIKQKNYLFSINLAFGILLSVFVTFFVSNYLITGVTLTLGATLIVGSMNALLDLTLNTYVNKLR